MRLPTFLAFRHLRMRLRSTLLTSAGVAAGVAVMSTMASMLLGLQGQFIENVVEATPHIVVEGAADQRAPVAVPAGENTVVALSRRPPVREEENIPNYRGVMRQIEQLPGVVAVAPTVDGTVLVRYGTRSQPARLSGIDPVRQARTVAWQARLRQQSGTLETTSNGVVLGIELAKNLGIPPDARLTLLSGPERSQRVQVVAFYQSGIRQTDERVLYANLRLAQSLLDRPSEVSELDVRINDINRAPSIARRIRGVTGLQASSWQETNAVFFSIFRLQNTITSMMIAFIVVIAGFGITNGLITLILEKQRDIGILKALGTTNSGIATVFLLEGVLMALVGALLGMGLAAIFINFLDNLPLRGEGQLSTETTFTMLRTPGVYLVPALIALGVSVVASVLPVRRATHYDPVEIIRSAK